MRASEESVPDVRSFSSGEGREARRTVSYSHARKINVLLILK